MFIISDCEAAEKILLNFGLTLETLIQLNQNRALPIEVVNFHLKEDEHYRLNQEKIPLSRT